MARNVEFGDDADAAFARVLQHFAHLCLRIEIAVGPGLLELRKELAFHAEALVVGEMPVKHVELYRCHGVQVAQHHFHRHPMAGDVQHQTAPREAWAIFDVNRWYDESAESIRAGSDQLDEGRQAALDSGHVRGREARAVARDIKLIRFVLAERRPLGAGRTARHPQGRPLAGAACPIQPGLAEDAVCGAAHGGVEARVGEALH